MPVAAPTSTAAEALHVFVKQTGGWVAAQLEACTAAGSAPRPAISTRSSGNPEFAPVWKIELLRRAYEQRFTLGGKVKVALGLDKPITDGDIAHWSTIVYEACTLCNKCAMVCPMGIQLGPLIHEVREAMAEAQVVPADLLDAVRKQEELGSPLGVTDEMWEERIEWIADEWEVDIPIDVQGSEMLVAFTSIELMKFPENIAAIAKILNAAGEKWTISKPGREVVNFGVFEGNPKHVKLFMSRLFDSAKALGAKRLVVTECGHAYDATLDRPQHDGCAGRGHPHCRGDRRPGQARQDQAPGRRVRQRRHDHLPRRLQDPAARRAHPGAAQHPGRSWRRTPSRRSHPTARRRSAAAAGAA
ncbi:MAG: (Fe-S)-binding protein [Kouleothrix sp.]|nr:(Fe-S)-binding protein [Kouleothrix sp.]